MVRRLLGDPAPGVHVVIKLHPQERAHVRWADLLADLARSAGKAPGPVTVVREIDIDRSAGAADAHLGLHSTVLTDAVVAGTPNLVATAIAHADRLDYAAAGVATAVRTAADVHAALRDPHPPEPAARAAFLARHFREGDAVGAIAEVLSRVAGR